MSFRWLIVCLFPVVAHAAPLETMAWHFPTRPNLDFLAENFEHINDPADAKSPGISVFTPKDQLVKDFSEPFRKHFNLGQDSWLVWNESRKLLVAHGIPVVLWQIEDGADFAKQLLQAQITFSWYQGIEPGKPVPPEAKPIHQSTIITRSGHEASQSWSSSLPAALNSTTINVESNVGGERWWLFESSFKLNWQEKKGDSEINWSYDASMAFNELVVPKRVCVQVDSRSGQSWTVAMEGSIVLMDGFPKSKSKLCESHGKEVAVVEDDLTLEKGRRTQLQTRTGPVPLVVFNVPSDFLSSISGMSNGNEEVDPFGIQSGALAPHAEVVGKSIFIPDDLKFILPRKLIEAEVERAGILIAKDGFVGFEPIHSRLYAVGLSETEFDKLEQLVSSTCRLFPKILKVSENLEAIDKNGKMINRRAVLFSRPGTESALTSSKAQSREVEEITVNLTIGNSDYVVDLRSESKFEVPRFESSNSLTLPVGIEVKGSAFNLEDGGALTQSWKASVISVYDPD